MPEQTELWRLVEAWRRRQRFNVSQAALAKDIGVARGAISQWKYGETRPTPANLRALQSATGIRYRDLLDAMLTDMGYLEMGASDGTATSDAGESPAQGTPTTPRASRSAGRGVRSKTGQPRLQQVAPLEDR